MPSPPYSLNGKTAIITGASHGLGVIISLAFVNAGAKVALIGRDTEALQEVATQLNRANHPVAKAILCDVRDPSSVTTMIQQSLQIFGNIDILVANAGIYGPIGLLHTVSVADWANCIQTNLIGTMLCCHAILPHMRSRGKGKIITLSGGGATGPRPHFSAYAASKTAIVRLTETLALENPGIDCNAIAPGALNTRLLEEVLNAGPEQAGRAAFDQAVQQHMTGGDSTQHAASLACFLASDASTGITGKLISAKWDDWQNLTPPLEEVRFTLRRIP